MAYGPFSILLTRTRRHLSLLSSLNPKPSFFVSHFLLTTKPFSTTPQTTSSDPTTKPSSLSARLSFVFDQIDAIEKERSEKHQTLQRIRTWKDSITTTTTTSSSQNDDTHVVKSEIESKSELGGEKGENFYTGSEEALKKKEEEVVAEVEVEVVHPWPEWIQLMERLVHQNYFDHRRKDEDRMVQELGFDASDAVGDEGDGDGGVDFTKDFKSVHMACLNFGKDRFDIMRSLSRKDIQILVGYGCPTVDKKVVFSAKLLRKHVHLDEGDVCSSCSLRNNCERAYLVTNKEDEARTIDVMRLLLTFGFDPINGSVINKSLLKQKSLKTVVRKLLHEVVKLSSVPIDPNLPPPVIRKPPPKVKQPPPPPKKRVGRDDVDMKKGDWLCPKCDFMNFAKNTICLQCDAKRPKRQLLPGEWECPECNFLNYRRNMVCFHCECKRPHDEFLENKMQDRKQSSEPRLNRIGNRQEVSNAWNFDFDDNESDGADVAAFEYADAHARDKDFSSDNQGQHGNYKGWEGDFEKNNRVQGSHDGEYSNPGLNRPGVGFDDFDDEDDIDSYELETETQSSSSRMEASKNNFSEAEDSLELDDVEGTDDRMHARHKMASRRSERSHSIRKKPSFSESEDDELDFDTDEQRSVHSNFKYPHASAGGQKRKGRGPTKKLSFGSESDEDIGAAGLYSDEDDDLNERYSSRKNKGSKHQPFRQNNGNKHDYGRRKFTEDWKSGYNGGRKANMFNDDFDESPRQSYRDGRGSQRQSYRDGRGSQGQSYRNDRRSQGSDRNRKRFEDFDGSPRQSYSNGRRSGGNDGNRQRYGDRGRDTGRFNKHSSNEKDFSEFKNSRRVIER
ncbi:hypothetical protein RIF29_24463 [Crotalaria pallida]|uniref:RanBP2-type domain-containing protein n=1 Tax=Crotalaria pallida TaxID=3830 RepID=A0AAN9EKM3_CROPI